MTQEVVMVMGLPASGKSSEAQKYKDQGYWFLNRDQNGGRLDSLVPALDMCLGKGQNVVLDNTFMSAASRKQFILVCKRWGIPISCRYIAASKEDAQFNACKRMVQKFGHLPDANEIKKAASPNTFVAAVIFAMAKKLEKPNVSEGFTSVDTIPFVRDYDPTYTNRALILDYDGTLRKTGSGDKFPRSPKDVVILKGRTRKLQQFADEGYKLLGVSNQGGVGLGLLTAEDADACFKYTNELLGHDIEYYFCPHAPMPTCYCRKPQVGRAVALIEKHKLDPRKCIYVGDMTSDKTFAKRAGFQYKDAKEFFG